MGGGIGILKKEKNEKIHFNDSCFNRLSQHLCSVVGHWCEHGASGYAGDATRFRAD
jgi:hypothetical protein